MQPKIPHDFQQDIDKIAQIDIVPTMLDVISRTTGMGFIAIARVTEDRWITCSARDDVKFGLKPGDELQIKTTICNEIRDSGKAVIIDHVAEDPYFSLHHTPAMYGFQSYISVPIINKDGTFFGTLCAIDPEPRGVSSPEVSGMFKLFADLISFHLDAINQAALLEEKVAERTKQLRENYSELEKMNKELQAYAYISSHDLQEPLRKIQMLTSMIDYTEFDKLSDQGKDYFRRIQQSAARMQTLINDLLVYSRAVNSEKKLEAVDLGALVAEVTADFAEEINEKNASVIIGDMRNARLIPFQFRQLIGNLMSNSLKFSHADIAPEIQINSGQQIGSALHPELQPDDQYWHFSFSDNGVGFDPQYSEKIFEMFQSAHDRPEYAGTGLGLAIVRKIVDNHNGVITASSALNSGARFEIYLPA